ncbi:hypothetical protein [Corynebacterium heidelbergense]|uniref:Head-tail adaptor protein n=1 Tax=Corynebacterium heidelbergense TaxID=2055947 RepID=A0A364VC74_9CORY|nr:hypothetical protein [Corynebacterium heidelbergense]RAV34253.1 hypothetical protein CWC39_04170 [Corynebacterium heidelbergense]WCZ36975.1 hypothetical protein CHEID_07210 [Corynebacterium heidelbergense]
MGLRSNTSATDRVVVVLREMRPGKRGVDVPTEIGRVSCLGRMQESTSTDVQAYAAAGETGVLNLKRFYTRVFPGDDLSQVIDADGVLWNVVGEPKRHRGSRGTARDVVALRQSGVRRGVRDGHGL